MSSNPPPPAPSGWRLRLRRARDVFEYAVHMARQARLAQVAGSLTFSSMLALVPLLAVVLAVLTAFPVFTQFRESLERDLPNGLLPMPYAQTILRYLTEFAAKAAGVGAAGLVFLALSALSMILTVDRVLNDIWLVHRRRPLVQRLLVYWAVLSVGPLLLGVSLSLTSFVMSFSAAGMQGWSNGLRDLFSLLAPLLAAAAYSIVYALVPNRRVAWSHALTGGVATAITGELMSRGFAAYVIHGSVLSVYGAFAAVPVFLMWIYLSWLTFLFGAAIAATLPQLRTTRFSDHRRAGNRAVTAIALLKVLFDARSGAALRAISAVELGRVLRTDEQDLTELLGQLEALGYVRKLAPGDGISEEWILTCDPQNQGLGPAYHYFAIDPENSLLRRPDLGLAAWLAPALHGPWLERGLAQLSSMPATRSGTVPA